MGTPDRGGGSWAVRVRGSSISHGCGVRRREGEEVGGHLDGSGVLRGGGIL